jgi:hypothetical protein
MIGYINKIYYSLFTIKSYIISDMKSIRVIERSPLLILDDGYCCYLENNNYDMNIIYDIV